MIYVYVMPRPSRKFLAGRSLVVTARPSGHGWVLTSPTGRQPLADADTAEELATFARAHGAKRCEVIR